MPAQKKIEQVKDLTERLKKAKSVVLLDYRGLTHPQLATLQKKLKESGNSLTVTKNTLLELALKNSQFPISNFQFPISGPTATLFITDDPFPPLKVLNQFFKEFDLPKIKIGILEGELANQERVFGLATLPSQEILRAQVVAYLKTPTERLTLSLAWNLKKLVTIIEKFKEQKSN